MIFNCLTIFPEMFLGFRGTSLCEKAISKQLIEVNTVNFRDFTEDKHNRVDDYPFGGGAGMLLMPQPLFSCFEALGTKYAQKRTRNVYMSPAGRTLTQQKAEELSGFEVVNILCGHYEGVDQRVLDHLIDEEISIGDYVLTGGELPAMVLMDCVMPVSYTHLDVYKRQIFTYTSMTAQGRESPKMKSRLKKTSRNIMILPHR